MRKRRQIGGREFKSTMWGLLFRTPYLPDMIGSKYYSHGALEDLIQARYEGWTEMEAVTIPLDRRLKNA